ncbi:ABC-type transport auxiliary lipoprotein family protein [Cognatiluteimonas lumbrici]|uniref:ABC-type transport auxiliary lipoprotein family protein n=1 Tax=Cognatiluteimonas lumbrici TaxID=2559601 RepID=UPI001FE5ADBC|nr:ABC-type transport auxiliary lipoprotein family protein [Luteimonas lumbrici]
MLLAGCTLVGGEKEPVSIYAPVVQVAADPAWPVAQWQLGIPKVHAGGMLESRRIAVRPVPGELQVYKGALWASEPAEQLRDAVLRTLEDSDKIAAVARQESGIASDYRLELDLRRYEADYGGAPSPAALVEVHAKLVRSIGREVVAEQTFREAVPAQGADVAQVAQAFGIALGEVAGDIAGWTLRSGKSL